MRLYPVPAGIWRLAKIIGWNALLTILGLALLGIAGETYLRLTKPFMAQEWPTRFVPGVGLLSAPNTEIRGTDRMNFWTVTRTNRLGFWDREPVAPELAAAGCHISIIGDSFVLGREVHIADKIQVRLEKLAEQRLPNWNITTSAFGYSGTGQFNQLPYYEQYARKLYPNLVVLVFVLNDFSDNAPHLKMIRSGLAPGQQPHLSATQRADGALELHPPHPDYQQFLVPSPSPPLYVRLLKDVSRVSWFAARLEYWRQRSLFWDARKERQLLRNAAALRQRPDYPEGLLDGWQPRAADGSINYTKIHNEQFTKANPAPIYQEAITFTGLALQEFRTRTARDGAALVILATHTMGGRDSAGFAVLNDLAAAPRIPVVSQYDYIRRQVRTVEEAHWPADWHWNEQGHQWGAEALLEWLEQNPQVCAPPA